MKLSLLTHDGSGNPPGKFYCLHRRTGELVGKVTGAYSRLHVETLAIERLADLVPIIQAATALQHLVAGVSRHASAVALPEKAINGSRVDGVSGLQIISRKNDELPHSTGQALMVMDTDGEQPSAVITQLARVCPGIEKYARIETSSSGSNIFHGEKELRGERGQHTFTHVKDGTDTPRVLEILHKRLIAAGKSRYKVSEAGIILERSAVDLAMRSSSQPIYLKPQLGSGLTQKKRIEYFDGIEILDTRKLVSDLTEAEESQFKIADAAAREALREEAAHKRQQYINRRIHEVVQINGGDVERARATVIAALDGGTLGTNFSVALSNNTTVTVGEILADPPRYHEQYCRDPLEPTYGSATVAMIFSEQSVPVIKSWAHGEKIYKLELKLDFSPFVAALSKISRAGSIFSEPRQSIALADAPEVDPVPDRVSFDLDYPPGLVGDVARYIYDSSRNPIRSFAIAGALSAVAYLSQNRAYVKPSSTALNLYQTLIGETGSGKEDPRKAIKRICDIAGLTDGICETLASGPAMLRALEEQQSLLILSDEFGLFLQVATSERGSMHLKELIKELMQLFSLGRSFYAGKRYADKKLRIERINHPYVNVMGTTTMVELLEGLTTKSVTNGFVNRILFIEASEKGAINRRPDEAISESLKTGIAGLFPAHGMPMAAPALEIDYEAGAEALMVSLAEQMQCPGQFAELWNRTEELMIRVAGVLAVGEGKIIRKVHVEWAHQYVKHCIKSFAVRLSGDLSETPFEKRMVKALSIISKARDYAGDIAFHEFCKKGYMPRGKLTKMLRLPSREVEEVVRYLLESRQIAAKNIDGTTAYRVLTGGEKC